MFNNLGDFGYQRSTKEACGFYLAYLIGLLVFAMIIGLVAGSMQGGVILGSIIVIIASPVLTFLVINAKGLKGNSYLYIIAAIAGAVLLGGLLGFIPAAYLTTKPAANSKR